MSEFIYYRNTKDRCASEKEADLMEVAEDGKEAIDYLQFVEDVKDFDKILKDLEYPDDLDVATDWSVGFYESTYGGLPCRIFSHTLCDFIFLRPEDAKMIAKHYSKDGDPEWRRNTSFGKTGMDPTYSKFVDDV